MIVIHFDAGVRVANIPCKDKKKRGKAASAIVVTQDGETVDEWLIGLELATVNEAEWTGLLAALDWVLDAALAGREREFIIVGDSMIAIQQFRGKEEGEPWQDDDGLRGFQISREAAHLIPYRTAAWERYAAIKSLGCTVKLRHTLRDGNARADYLTQALNDEQQGKTVTREPHGTLYPEQFKGKLMQGYPL